MKVLQIGKYYPPRWGGMETAVKDICEMLASEVDLEVLVANSEPKRLDETASGVPVTRLPNLLTAFSQPIVPGLFGEIRRRHADIVHLHEPNPFALFCFLASRHPAKLVIHYHSDIVKQRRLMRLYRPILERGLDRADAIIVGSPHLRDSSPVLARWRHKCVVVPFGIDLAPFLRVRRCADVTGLPQILAVGRLSYYKGFQYLIDAVQHLPVKLVIAGDGDLRGSLNAQVIERKLQDRVTLTGKVTIEKLLALYAESDLFCLPSCERSEAFGLAMVEGMAAGLPVISTNLPTGVQLVNQHGVTGLVVPPSDVAALSRAIESLAADRPRRLAYGAAGRQRAQALFSRERMGRSILDVYRGVVGSGAREPEEALAH